MELPLRAVFRKPSREFMFVVISSFFLVLVQRFNSPAS